MAEFHVATEGAIPVTTWDESPADTEAEAFGVAG
jgi:hypothetical protein